MLFIFKKYECREIFHSPDWLAPDVHMYDVHLCVVATKVEDHGLTDGERADEACVLGGLLVDILADQRPAS